MSAAILGMAVGVLLACPIAYHVGWTRGRREVALRPVFGYARWPLYDGGVVEQYPDGHLKFTGCHFGGPEEQP